MPSPLSRWKVAFLALTAALASAPADGAPPASSSGHSAVAQKKKRPKGKPARGGPAPLPPAPSPEVAPREMKAPPWSVERLTLDNGLRVVLAPDSRAAQVAVAVLYDAGARLEDRSSAGLANLARQAMSLGSANVLRGEHERHVAGRGGSARSEVTSERAAYLDVLPSHELPLGLWLEADRLKSLQITADGVNSQRELLSAELLLRQGHQPLDAARSRARELIFQAFWPYEHDPAGSPADAAALKHEAVQSFYETYYAANNAVLVITGDIEVEPTTQQVRRFFETARKQDRPPAFVAPPQPEQTSQRSAVLESASVRAPSFVFGWATPPGRTDDSYAIDAALFILARVRLPLRLQRERGLASRVEATLEKQRIADLARIEVDLTDDAARAEAERLVEAEIEALARSGPSDAELARYRDDAEARAWRAYQSIEQRALLLGDFELLHGDARLLGGELGRAASVSRDKVRAAAARYLSPSRRTLVELLPPRSGAAPAATPPAPAFHPPPAPHHGARHQPRPAKPPKAPRPPKAPKPPKPRH